MFLYSNLNTLEETAVTDDGIRFVFGRMVLVMVFGPMILVAAMALAFADRSAFPLLLALLIPLCFTKATWTFRYAGPSVERRTTLFGRTIIELQKSWMLLRSRDPDELERVKRLLNEAIHRVHVNRAAA